MAVIKHELSSADALVMQAVRTALAQGPKIRFDPASRATYDGIIAQAPAPESVSYEQGEVGGVAGWWCRPADADERVVMLYLHGGGYVIGSATAYRNFVGHIARRAGAAAFIADYALVPERPFPAAFSDVGALHQGLLASDYEHIALCGDSAGAGLALSFLADRTVRPDRIVSVVAMSPWLDLSLSGSSMVSRASEDPILSKAMLAEGAASYVGRENTADPRPDPLDGDVSTMPPVRIHVGSAEVLLDDSLRFESKARQAGLNCEVHVWEGMIHVFPSNVAMLEAAANAGESMGAR